MNIGLEMEYWVVDEEGRLSTSSELLDTHECVTNEFVDSLIEIQLPPVESASQLETVLGDVLSTVVETAAKHDRQLVPLGTPLTEHDLPIITDRGRVLEQLYGDDLIYAKNCAGTHVHFDKGHTLRQLNLLTALDPVLALVSSSPYYGRKRVASSSRSLMYRHQSDAVLERYRGLWAYADSLDSWNTRVTEAHDLFKQIALNRGIDPETVDRHFHPENTVLTPVRLRKRTPTVEWRAPDVALPSQIVDLVRDVHQVLLTTETHPVVVGIPGRRSNEIGIPSFAELRGLTAAAIVDGLDSDRVCHYLSKMGFNPSAYTPISSRIRGPYEISPETAREIRLQYATELNNDL
ncbi:glutamate-cysteine ligase family protein [Halorubrum sp. AJ67]|uniref:glutamate-cysteine ligase family protein n=1 Tax=Halorubrum sp. AJ67 TaxID=1173487 RepID=UPI0003DC6A88|nr:glutamate-cysteine ligase family protein [Halorubrum sp. AJ67]CDK38322.1 glutamate--cysteine ligase GCS2 [Halorubrum sp. AJ67]